MATVAPIPLNVLIEELITVKSKADRREAVEAAKLLGKVIATNHAHVYIEDVEIACGIVNALHDGGLLMKTLERTLSWHFRKQALLKPPLKQRHSARSKS